MLLLLLPFSVLRALGASWALELNLISLGHLRVTRDDLFARDAGGVRPTARRPPDLGCVPSPEAPAPGCRRRTPDPDPEQISRVGECRGSADALLDAGFHPRVNGYSGSFPTDYLEHKDVFNRFPAPAALRAARTLGVRYFILHEGSYEGFPQYRAAQIATMLQGLPPTAHASHRGSAWLIDLGPHR